MAQNSLVSDPNKALRQHHNSPLSFLACVEQGNAKEVEVALTHKRHLINETDGDGRTPVLLACLRGHLDIVKLLAKIDIACLHQRDTDPQRGGGAIHYAAWGGHLDVIEYLHHHSADFSDVDLVGNTPLLYSVYGGHLSVAQYFVAQGRSLKEVNNKGHTAIIQAACGGHRVLVSWLLSQGASLDERDDVGNTALLFAAWGGHLGLVEWLLEEGSSLSEVSDTGHTALLSAANSGKQDIVEWLLRAKNVDIMERNHNGDSALLLAAFGGHCGLLRWLLEQGCALTETNADGLDPLLSACNGGHRDMVEMLLNLGCDLHFKNQSGYTALILAACGGHQNLVEWLVHRGCSLDDRTDDGDSALLLSCYCGHKTLVDWILKNGGRLDERNNTGLTPLISAANGGHPEVVEMLLDRGSDINETDNDGYSAVLLAARRGYLDTVLMLALRGADLTARTRHRLDIVQLSVEQPKVRLWMEVASEFRPLHFAVALRSISHIRRLLHSGADPLCRTKKPVGDGASMSDSDDSTANPGPTPLDLATVVLDVPKAKPVCPHTLQLIRRAAAPWSPSTHNLFGPKHRSSVVLALMVRKRLSVEHRCLPELPPEVWHHIIGFIGRSVEVEEPQHPSSDDEGKIEELEELHLTTNNTNSSPVNFITNVSSSTAITTTAAIVPIPATTLADLAAVSTPV